MRRAKRNRLTAITVKQNGSRRDTMGSSSAMTLSFIHAFMISGCSRNGFMAAWEEPYNVVGMAVSSISFAAPHVL